MTAADELVAFLRTRGGEAPASACSEHLRARGYGSAARKSAKERARVVSRKSGYGGRWVWQLPDAADTPAVPGGRPPRPQPEGGPVVTIVVSPGPRNARTDPETGLRTYRWQGRDLPSVTSLRRHGRVALRAPPVGHRQGRRVHHRPLARPQRAPVPRHQRRRRARAQGAAGRGHRGAGPGRVAGHRRPRRRSSRPDP